MISKRFTVLEIRDGKEYVFSSFDFKAAIRKYKTDRKSSGESLTNEDVFDGIADKASVSVDAIKNWMYGKNGPADLETVKNIANFLQVDYTQLLRVQENKTMSEEKVIVKEFNIDMNKTKDVIRVVYQKMSAFMDAAVSELCFEESQEIFWQYEEEYKDVLVTLHKSMLDIPIHIYDQLKEIVENDFYLYMYGIPEGGASVWDLTEYSEFCDQNNIFGYFGQMAYMEQQAEKFYTKIREILKDYLVA